MKNLKIQELISNQTVFKQMLIESLKIPVECFEYRTFDECLCSANYFICSKKECTNSQQAFVTLINYELHFYQGWNIHETNEKDLDSISNIWLTPSLKQTKTKIITANESSNGVESIVNSIENCINQNMTSNTPERWGVFLNDRRITGKPSIITSPISEPVIALNYEWNDIELFYETPSTYVLFSWDTGA